MHRPPSSKLLWGGKKRKNEGKEMCNLFRAYQYFEEDILNQIIKEAGEFFYQMSEVTDIPLLIRKYCIIKKARVKLAIERTLFMHFWCLL